MAFNVGGPQSKFRQISTPVSQVPGIRNVTHNIRKQTKLQLA